MSWSYNPTYGKPPPASYRLPDSRPAPQVFTNGQNTEHSRRQQPYEATISGQINDTLNLSQGVSSAVSIICGLYTFSPVPNKKS